MPPKRRVPDAADDDEPAAPAAMPLREETADLIATRLCRFVLLREHMRKPATRSEIKDAVMTKEQKAQDRSGKIFKQVLAAANEKLRDIAALELVCETEAGAAAADDDDGAGGASQAGPSQAAAGGRSGGGGSAANARYLLVNRLAAEPVVVPRTDAAPGTAIYLAFVEVVLCLLGECEGAVCSESDLFDYLGRIGLDRESKLPQPAEQDKIESLVQKRLTAEAFLKRRKKANDDQNYEYLPGPRAILNRDADRAANFHALVLESS